jgi:hypothetical protein
MVVRRSGTGFGHFRFGHAPFGQANFGEDVITKSLPEEYLLNNDGTENQLIAHYLYTIEDSVNRIKDQIDLIDEQVDFTKVRSDIIQYLGKTIDVVVDDSEPIEFQRSLVGNAIQYYQIKGTGLAYKIRGKISGFDVTVDNLYKLAPDLVSSFSSDDLFELPAGSNIYYTNLEPGSVSGTPTEVGCDYCLTSYIKLNFQIVKAQPPSITGEGNFFDRLTYKLREIIPIHVRDVLFELTAIIIIDNSDQTVLVSSHETSFNPTPFFYRFDSFSADCVPCDWHGSVSGLVNIQEV